MPRKKDGCPRCDRERLRALILSLLDALAPGNVGLRQQVLAELG